MREEQRPRSTPRPIRRPVSVHGKVELRLVLVGARVFDGDGWLLEVATDELDLGIGRRPVASAEVSVSALERLRPALCPPASSPRPCSGGDVLRHGPLGRQSDAEVGKGIGASVRKQIGSRRLGREGRPEQGQEGFVTVRGSHGGDVGTSAGRKRWCARQADQRPRRPSLHALRISRLINSVKRLHRRSPSLAQVVLDEFAQPQRVLPYPVLESQQVWMDGQHLAADLAVGVACRPS